MDSDGRQKVFSGRDRRAHPRASLDLDVSIGMDDMPVLPVITLNLSASGLYCVSRMSLGELSRIELVIRLDEEHEISARAVVIRQEPLSDGSFGIGMFFTSISDENRAIISEMVARANEKAGLE